MFGWRLRKWGRAMRDEIINGSWAGIMPDGMTREQKVLAVAIALIATVLLLILPNL
jgi:hypothetical protein